MKVCCYRIKKENKQNNYFSIVSIFLGTPLTAILSKEPEKLYNLNDVHHLANPPSREQALVRFPENPAAFWGPGTRATLMVGDKQMKSVKNQNKNKRCKNNSISEQDQSKQLKMDLE